MKRLVLLAALVIVALRISPGQDYQMPVRITPALVSAALDPALMCLAAYTDTRVAGWAGPELKLGGLPLDDPISGFHACLYQREYGGVVHYWLAFRGTEGLNDWLTNWRQNVRRQVPDQYRLAYLHSQQLKALILVRRAEGKQAEIGLAGHSLGAGLAAFSALCWAVPAFCFASAPLAEGTEKQIIETGLVGLRRAPDYVIHVFLEGDRVPDASDIQLLGDHFGRVVTPDLEPPENLSGIDDGRQRLNTLMLAGLVFDTKKSMFASGVNGVVDGVARHHMANYITALMQHASPPDGAPFLAGCWISRGRFFELSPNIKVSSNDTAFILHGNGALDLQNEFFILGTRSFTADEGTWTFDGQILRVAIPNLATMEYQMMGMVEQRAISWRRTRVTPDEVGFMRANGKEGDAAAGALLLLKGVCHMMQDKDVAWTRGDQDLFSELFK